MKILPLALGGAALYYLATRGFNIANSLQRLSYTNPRVKFKRITLSGIELEITLDIQNPGSSDINLDYFTGAIMYAGKNISSFTFNANGKNQVLKARNVTTLPFTVVIKSIATITSLIQIANNISNASKTVSPILDVTGSLYAAGFDIPVNFQYDLQRNVVVKGIVTGVGSLSAADYLRRKRSAAALEGIGTVKASLEFSSNKELEKYFTGKKSGKKLMFSKN